MLCPRCSPQQRAFSPALSRIMGHYAALLPILRLTEQNEPLRAPVPGTYTDPSRERSTNAPNGITIRSGFVARTNGQTDRRALVHSRTGHSVGRSVELHPSPTMLPLCPATSAGFWTKCLLSTKRARVLRVIDLKDSLSLPCSSRERSTTFRIGGCQLPGDGRSMPVQNISRILSEM